MVATENAVTLIVTLTGALLVLGAIASWQLPGTLETGNPLAGDGEPRYDIDAKIGLEGTLNGVRFAEDTFRCTAERSGLTSFSIAEGGQQFSFLGGKNVEVFVTLEGEQLDGPVRNKFVPGNKFLGTDGRVGATDSFVVPFEASKLPAGQYTLTYEAFWTDDVLDSKGHTKLTKQVSLPEGCA